MRAAWPPSVSQRNHGDAAPLERQSDAIRLHQGAAGRVDAAQAEQHAQEDDEHVVPPREPGERVPLELQVEVARPDEAEHDTGDAADEAHQDGEVRDDDGHDDGEDYHDHAEGEADGAQLAVQRPDGRQHGVRPALEVGAFQQLAGGVVGQRVAQQRLHHQEEVDELLEALRRQVVGDDLLRGALPREEADVAEQRLEGGGGDVRPVEHAHEPARVAHVPLQRRQEDLRRVREHDDAQADGEVQKVDAQLHLGPAPLAGPGEAVAEDEHVDHQVRHRAPEAERADVVQVLEEAAGDQQHAAEHHPGAGVDLALREHAHQQVAAQHHVQDAGHEQLDQLRAVDNAGAPARSEAHLGDADIAVPHAHQLAVRGLLPEGATAVSAPAAPLFDFGGDFCLLGNQHHEREKWDSLHLYVCMYTLIYTLITVCFSEGWSRLSVSLLLEGLPRRGCEGYDWVREPYVVSHGESEGEWHWYIPL